MGGRDEQADLSSRNNNQSEYCLVRAVKIDSINSQVTTNVYDIDEPDPGTIAVNELDMNSDKCYLGANFTVFQMTSKIVNVYTYDPSYKPLYTIPIVMGSTTVIDNILKNSFIVVVN